MNEKTTAAALRKLRKDNKALWRKIAVLEAFALRVANDRRDSIWQPDWFLLKAQAGDAISNMRGVPAIEVTDLHYSDVEYSQAAVRQYQAMAGEHAQAPLCQGPDAPFCSGTVKQKEGQ